MGIINNTRIKISGANIGNKSIQAIKNPYITSQLHTDQTNNKLYLYEKTNTTNIIITESCKSCLSL